MLCTTFKRLSEWTWEEIEISKSVSFQLKEETLTDQNLLQLKRRHAKEIHTHVFNKHEEGKNGADWEWWLTDGTTYYGFRIQAKIINNDSDRFEHLHYQGKAVIPQSEKLIVQATPKGEVPRAPFYCMFMATDSLKPTAQKFKVEHFGCSLLSALDVRALRLTKTDDVKSLKPFLIPWHKLVCKSPSISLDGHLKTFMDEFLPQVNWRSEVYGTSKPPEYIRLAYQSNASLDYNYENLDLTGIVVIELENEE